MTVIDKPGKGMIWATDAPETLLAQVVSHLVFAGATTESHFRFSRPRRWQ